MDFKKIFDSNSWIQRDEELIERDPKKLNKPVYFNEIIAEPSGAYSASLVLRASYIFFNFGMKFGYMLLTFILSIWISLFWGCTFAVTSFFTIWIYTPFSVFLNIILLPTKKIIITLLETFVEPIFEAFGHIYSRINIITNAKIQTATLEEKYETNKTDNLDIKIC